MNFHWPYVLLALPVALAVLLTLFARSHRARQRLLAQFAAARLLPALLASYSPGLRRLKHLLVVTGVLLIVLALARPQWGYEWQEQRARGVDVIFVVDTSKSMLTQDVPPSRLERAKLAIMDLVEKMPGNRVGLVAFAGQAFLQCPLTLDYDAFRQSLEAIDTNTIARGGTNIAAGLDEAASALESSGNHKIIVLLSDGEDLEGDGVSTAKTLHDQGVIIYTVGVGTPQGDIIPLPTKDGQVDFVRDDHGQIVKSHLDAATLTAIANSTGGFYQPLGSTGEGLNQVYEAGIKTIPEQQIASREQRLPLERFQWPLAAGVLLLALELLIGTRRPFRTEERPRSSPPIPAPKSKSAARAATPVVAALVLVAACALAASRAKADDSAAPIAPPNSPTQTPSPPSGIAQPPVLPSPASVSNAAALPPPASPGVSPQIAEQLFQHGDYKAAASAYGQAADQAPNDARFRYDQGASLYHSGDYDGAAHAFEQTLPANDLSLQQRAYYGLGDSRYRLGQAQLKEDPKKTITTWESAVKDYQNALELNPNDTDAHYNLGLLKTQLEQLKKQQEQQQKQQQQQQDQQSQQDQKNQQDNKQNQQNQKDQQNQSDQKNQPGQQGQQNQQNQQGQQGQQDQKNQPGQQGQQNQQQQQNSGQQGQQPQQSNSPGSRGASQENQPNQNQTSGQNQQKNQPQPGQDQKQNQGQSPQSAQNQTPGQNGDQKQPQPQPGAGDKPQPNNQSQPPNANGQPKPSPQPQPNGTEPTAAKPGQSSGNSTATAGAAGASTDKNGETGADAITAPGVMTREEARQVLDSLKNSERKLPVDSYDSQKEGAQSSDQTFKDW
jgi:Ca-activated chloride channel homolog